MAFTHLLVPTDFSEPANSALRYAAEEAGLHHARLTLLHVLPPETRTAVHYVTGAPAETAQGGFAAAFAGSAFLAQPETVRRDPSEEALTQLRDLLASAFRAHRKCCSRWDTRWTPLSASPRSRARISLS